MRFKTLAVFAVAALSVLAVACTEVVFPSPLPTVTPAPTATPIVFPTPLPTVTPFAVVFPTPLPTATPAPTATPISVPGPVATATPSSVVFPTPLPTATPAPTVTPFAVVFPTPLPTATPVSFPEPERVEFPTPLPTATPAPIVRTNFYGSDDAFVGIGNAKVQPLYSQATNAYGVGFRFESDAELCQGRSCLLTAWHVIATRYFGLGDIWDGSCHGGCGRWEDEEIYRGSAPEHDADLDVTAFVAARGSADLLPAFGIAPKGTAVVAGEPIRVVTIDFWTDVATNKWIANQMVLSGVVSRLGPGKDRFMVDAPILQGNSGGMVLNADMKVIGIVVKQFQYRHPTGEFLAAIPSRNQVVHVDAIRGFLCDRGFLPSRDCR